MSRRDNLESAEPEFVRPETEKFQNGLETNLFHIAKIIFAKPPGPAYSIGLQLDHDLKSNEDPAQVHNEILTTLIVSGAHILYGDQVTLDELNSRQLATLRDYMISVGFDPVIHRDEENETFNIEFKPYCAQLQPNNACR